MTDVKKIDVVGSPKVETKAETFTSKPCKDCGQREDRCLRSHVRAEFRCKDPEHQKYFQGVFLNGIRYKGSCIVPLLAYHDLMADLSHWEEGEKQLKRADNRMVNGGSIQ